MRSTSIVLRKEGGVLHAFWSRGSALLAAGPRISTPSLFATLGVFLAVLLVPLAGLALLAALVSGAHPAHAHSALLGAGVLGTTVDFAAVKAEIDKLQRAFAEFREANDEELKQIKAHGSADPLLSDKVNKLNDELSTLQANVNRLAIGTVQTDSERPENREMRETIRAFLRGDDHPKVNKRGELSLHALLRDHEVRPLQSRIRRGQLDEIYAAQGVGSTGAGGAVVPQGFSGQLEQALLFYSGMMQESTIITTDTGAALPWPTINDTTQAGARLAENATIPAQDATFASTTLNAWKYTSKLIAVSWELIQDSFFNIDELVGELAGTRIGRILNTEFTTGTGSGASMPNGAQNAAASGKVGATGQTTSVIFDDLMDLLYSVDLAYRLRSIWMMNDQSIKVIRKLKDSQNRPLWEPSQQADQPQMLLGKRLVTNNDVPVMAANAKSILFGDFTRYKVRRVRDITLVRLNERYADNLQTGFFAFARFDGNLIDAGTHPIKFYQNSAT